MNSASSNCPKSGRAGTGSGIPSTTITANVILATSDMVCSGRNEDAAILAVAVIVTLDSPAAVPVTVMLSLDAETLTEPPSTEIP